MKNILLTKNIKHSKIQTFGGGCSTTWYVCDILVPSHFTMLSLMLPNVRQLMANENYYKWYDNKDGYEMDLFADEDDDDEEDLDGVTRMDGQLPVNPSGGLKSRGHPIGATGVSQHVMAAMQLSETAGDMQVKNARLGAVFNMGGAAVANYLSVLERVQ